MRVQVPRGCVPCPAALSGVTVPHMDNSVQVPLLGTVLDSNAQRGILGASIGAKGYKAAQDYPDN